MIEKLTKTDRRRIRRLLGRVIGEVALPTNDRWYFAMRRAMFEEAQILAELLKELVEAGQCEA